MELPILDQKTETEFSLNALVLNVALMPEARTYQSLGQEVPRDLNLEIAKKLAWIAGKSPNISAELIRRAERIKELEAQVAQMLLNGPADGKPGE